MSIRIAHMADWHLGKHRRYIAEREPQVAADIEAYARRLIQQLLAYLEEAKIDLLLVAGDTFDQPEPNSELKEAWFWQLQNHQSFPIVIVGGNHDPLAPAGPWPSGARTSKVYVLGKQAERWEGIARSGEKIVVDGQSFAAPTHDATVDLSSLAAVEADVLSLALLHGSWDPPLLQSHYACIPRTATWLRNYDYVALGHYHYFFQERIQGGRQGLVSSPGPLLRTRWERQADVGLLVGDFSRTDWGWQQNWQRLNLPGAPHWAECTLSLPSEPVGRGLAAESEDIEAWEVYAESLAHTLKQVLESETISEKLAAHSLQLLRLRLEGQRTAFHSRSLLLLDQLCRQAGFRYVEILDESKIDLERIFDTGSPSRALRALQTTLAQEGDLDPSAPEDIQAVQMRAREWLAQAIQEVSEHADY